MLPKRSRGETPTASDDAENKETRRQRLIADESLDASPVAVAPRDDIIQQALDYIFPSQPYTTPSLQQQRQQQQQQTRQSLPKRVLEEGDLIVPASGGSQFRIEKRLGAGRYATTYKAYSSLADTSVVLKRFFYIEAPQPTQQELFSRKRRIALESEIGNFESAEYMKETALREFRVSRIIKKRSDELLCGTDIVCAQRIFSVSVNEICIEFPFVEAVDLDQYMTQMFYPMLRVPDRIPIAVLDIIRVISNILRIVGRLSAIGIAHSDLTPQNVLIVRGSGVIKFIDFGLGCNFIDLLSETAETEDETATRCPLAYDTSYAFKDPLALSIRLSSTNVREMYELFAVYACGKIAQRLFDDTTSVNSVMIPIRQTSAMPRGVYMLIRSMCSPEITKRLRAAEYAQLFDIEHERYRIATNQELID